MAKEKEQEQMATQPTEGGMEAAAPKELSQRDRFRTRVQESNPELDMDDEDAYYSAANQRMDDLESYRNGVENLRGVMDSNPYFAQMIAEASKQKDFNPILYMIENGQLDIDAMRDDEGYAEKIASAQAKWLDQNTKSKELEDKIAANLPASIEACKGKAKELGMSDADTEAALDKYFSLLDEIEEGNLNPDIFELIAKGMTHDADVAEAEKQGAAQGRATKVKEKLSEMPTKASRSGGSQPSGAEQAPSQGGNMFGI